jgi:hypothetical protein
MTANEAVTSISTMRQSSTTSSERTRRHGPIFSIPEFSSSRPQYCKMPLYSNSQSSMLLVTQLVSIKGIIFRSDMLTLSAAIYNAAAAFCEGLHGEVQARSSRADVDYKMIDTQAQQNAIEMTGRLCNAIKTPQARAYWQWCTGSILFPIATIIRKWLDCRRTPARWQTVFFPQHVLDGWRHAAEDEAIKVSTFDLFSSWLHMVSPILTLCREFKCS